MACFFRSVTWSSAVPMAVASTKSHRDCCGSTSWKRAPSTREASLNCPGVDLAYLNGEGRGLDHDAAVASFGACRQLRGDVDVVLRVRPPHPASGVLDVLWGIARCCLCVFLTLRRAPRVTGRGPPSLHPQGKGDGTFGFVSPRARCNQHRSARKAGAVSLPNDTDKGFARSCLNRATQAAPATEASFAPAATSNAVALAFGAPWSFAVEEHDGVAARDGPFAVAAGEQDVDLQGRRCAVYACCSRFEQPVDAIG